MKQIALSLNNGRQRVLLTYHKQSFKVHFFSIIIFTICFFIPQITFYIRCIQVLFRQQLGHNKIRHVNKSVSIPLTSSIGTPSQRSTKINYLGKNAFRVSYTFDQPHCFYQLVSHLYSVASLCTKILINIESMEILQTVFKKPKKTK